MSHILQPDSQLDDWVTEQNLPAFRAAQIRRWLFASRAESFAEMTNLPLPLRTELEGAFQWWTSHVAAHKQAEDGTEKLLLEFSDQQKIECVLLREAERRTICISTQVGCGMGCVFCASGLDGVVRNLTAGEIIEQMLRLRRLMPEEERISHIVVMGMGEPLANLENLLAALKVAASSEGLGISPRRMTISTVGLPAAMRRLSQAGSQYNLAVSLHAANDTLRNELVPVNAKSGLEAILAAADEYFEASGRRLTFEYVLLGGVNDREQDAQQLATRLRSRSALLNLIPYNPVAGLPYRTPTEDAVARFSTVLTAQGVNVQIRRRKGSRIDAACGQLRRMPATTA
ncbi:MAG: 23S rRNA (adenine(2503)-C(2))-methyltransferase RlmN [Planctomycetota bacterium]|nr:23S rRNA (adenine(2503)-C(2))-methyltransferase RlmN [Planctomycetota bacterium]